MYINDEHVMVCKIVNFMSPGTGLVLRRGHISHMVKMLNFVKFSTAKYMDQTNEVYSVILTY